ncbi:MAG: glycosyltransferase family A protein [Caulobacter sp.]|nr:glycosyltransferase family A protein [Caulobacter sp.]
MTALRPDILTDNAAWANARPRLSVLIPFLGDDPAQLISELAQQGAEVEIILLDDGGTDEALAVRVTQAVQGSAVPARLLRSGQNLGRARGRNRLTQQARADYFLFLDADMLPDAPDFVARWLDCIETDRPAVCFGGFSMQRTPERRDHAVHRAMALNSDCLPADLRRLAPEKYVFTSNLLVRRDVFEAVAFDEGFTGWGWEDVEWAMRVARQWPIRHLDNPASHLGLDTTAALTRKYEQSAANFGRVVQEHPQVVAGYASYRVARMIRRLPGRGLVRGLARALALSGSLPTGLQGFGLRLYRAALYAEVV